MPPNKPQSNYSKRPEKRVRLLKFGPRKTKSLLEEYFYGFLASIIVGVAILGKAGGLSGYDASVSGLWVGGFLWFAWQVRRYRREQASPARMGKAKVAAQAGQQITAKPLSPNFKPMIGPQWPLKPVKGMPQPATAPGSQGKKPVFVYERPTLPDRKTKLPHNWPGRQDKKPKP
jgi:hypothetical protein